VSSLIRLFCLILLVLVTACHAPRRGVEVLGTGRAASDFDSYTIRRVGLVPFAGGGLDNLESTVLSSAFFSEVSAVTAYEVVSLDARDLAEVPPSEPYRRGWYRPETVLGIARRFQLDALLIGTVTDRASFPHQRLGVQLELVAAETGMVIWSAAVQLDTSQRRVRDSVESWAREHLGAVEESEWQLVMMSPSRFARFAAFQIAELL
jgi:hypothetical protein